MRAVCMGDVHLGARPHGIDLLPDQAQVLTAIAELASIRDADVILCGGDVFEGPLLQPEQEQVFAEFVDRCRMFEIPVVTVTGNGKHDLGTRERNALTVFKHVPGITVADQPGLHGFADGVAICCLPWTPVSALAARYGDVDRDDLNVHAAELLLRIAGDMLEKIGADNDPFVLGTVLLLHWSISGASLPTGLAIDEHAREPILPLDDLAALGFDAVVASHIHKLQLMNGQPPVFYTGSPIPLNFGEANTEHGCWILDVGDGPAVAEFVPLPGRRFVTLDLAPDDDGSDWEVDIEDAIVKVRSSADRRNLEASLLRLGAYRVIVEPPQIERASRARVDGASAEMSEAALIRAWCDANDLAERAEDLLALAAEWRVTAWR